MNRQIAGEVSRDNTNKSNDTNEIGRYIVANQNTNIHFTGSKLVKPSLVSNVGGTQTSRCQVIKNKTAMKHGIFMVFGQVGAEFECDRKPVMGKFWWVKH